MLVCNLSVLGLSQPGPPAAWEQILLNYQVVPGYANEQVSPNFQLAVPLQLDKNGTINGDPAQH